VKRVPIALVCLRALCVAAMLTAGITRARGIVLAIIVSVAFVSDVFDGIIARRLGVATPGLRRADTIVDTAFYIGAALTLLLRTPGVVWASRYGVALLVVLEGIRLFVDRRKFGRMAAYHMWSAKAWGLALWLGFCEAFLTGRPGPLFRLAVGLGIAADLEGLAASRVLSRWTHDVPTVWHAVRIERGRHDPAEASG